MSGHPTDLREYGWYWFQDIVNRLIAAFESAFESTYTDIGGSFETGTPGPSGGFDSGLLDAVFGTATEEPWISIHDGLVPTSGGTGIVTAMALIVLLVSVQSYYVTQIFSSGTAYRAHKTRRSAWVGAALILLWYWLAVSGLAIVDVFHQAVIENWGATGFETELLTQLESIDTESANRAWLLPLFAVGAVCLWFVEAVLYLRYELLLPLFVYMMPVLLGLIYGNVPMVGTVARGLAEKFISLLILPIPLVLLFWGYDTVLPHVDQGSNFEAAVIVVSFPVVAAYVVYRTLTLEYPSGDRLLAAAATTRTAVGTAVERARGHRPQAPQRAGPAGDRAGAAESEEERPAYRRSPPHEHW